MEREFNDQQLVRRQKAEELKTKGINPFGKACTENFGGRSRKDRIFITAQVYK